MSNAVNKYHKQASSISSLQHQQASLNSQVISMTQKPSQRRDKTLKELLEDLKVRNLPKSPRLQQHFIKSHLNLDTTLEDEVRTPKSCKDSEAVQRT